MLWHEMMLFTGELLRIMMMSTLLLLLLPFLITAAATGKASASLTVLDLSYHHNLKADVLAPAIRQHLWKDQRQKQENDQHVKVDLSNSLLGDDGLKILIESLLPTTTLTAPNVDLHDKGEHHHVAIQLALRMNQLTHVGVTKLLQTIVAGPIAKEPQNLLSNKQESPTITTTTPDKGSPETDDKSDNHLHEPWQWYVESLDLSWNDLSTGEKSFHRALNQLLADKLQCPKILRLDLCGLGPAACRAMAKGIIQRFEDDKPKTPSSENLANNGDAFTATKPNLLTLHLSGNEALGDAGAATLAAAIRTVIMKKSKSRKNDTDMLVLEKLNLSACSIGDAGNEALSLALETHPRCVLTLDLSNNLISDAGVAALGRALLSSARVTKQVETTTTITSIGLDELDLSNNVEIGDRGASILADCLIKGMIRNAVLRSCHVRADGAAAFGRALRLLCQSKYLFLPVSLDLSGNALGVLRGKSVSSGKYSGSRLKSKAGATTASYMNFIGKKIRAGLKDVVGVDVSPLMGASAENDEDDEDEGADGKGTKSQDDDVDASEARCGIKALANAFLEDANDDHTPKPTLSHDGDNGRQCHLGLRRCSLDHAAADALAAAVLFAKDEYGIDLVVDVSLNPVLEDEMVSALRGDGDEYYLREMAERHNDAMSALKQAQQRAKEAAAAVSARARMEDTENEWDLPNVQGEETWDSDADYEDEDEIYDDEA